MAEVTRLVLAQIALKSARGSNRAGKPKEAIRSYKQAVYGYKQVIKEYTDEGRDAAPARQQVAQITSELNRYKEKVGAAKTARYAKVA